MDRFAVKVDKQFIEQLILDIEDYVYRPIVIEDDGRSFHPVKINNVDIVVLYNWEDRKLITAFYPSWFKQNENGEWLLVYRMKQKRIKYLNRQINKEKKLFGVRNGGEL